MTTDGHSSFGHEMWGKLQELCGLCGKEQDSDEGIQKAHTIQRKLPLHFFSKLAETCGRGDMGVWPYPDIC